MQHFNTLLQFQKALGLSYKDSQQLDSIIDTKLLGKRPSFNHAEVELDGEIFNVYFCDILACIRALFGDKSFAPYLLFAPERHYTDMSRKCQLYHDMHTGKWWWDTQVCII